MPNFRASRLRPAPAAAVAATLTAAAAGTVLAVTPWPAALLIRGVFHRGARQLIDQMKPWSPQVPEHRNIKYQADGGARRLDIYLPPGHTAETPAPVVFWVHGGAWISGSRRDVAPYLRMLAARGFAAVGVDYSVAPGSIYPRALQELNQAVQYLRDNAGDYGLDMDRVVLAGDSAGAQLAAQLAAAVSSPGYASELGISPGLSGPQLRGALLHCGVYDLEAMGKLTGILGWGFRTALWAYIGKRRFSETPAAEQMSVISHATAAFPPAFISGGNGDGLTAAQSVPFADRLESLGVAVTRSFWPQDLSPALPHEAQFQFSRPEARAVLDETADFLNTVLHVRPSSATAESPAGSTTDYVQPAERPTA
ncbi:alpha/beta hydrolase [Arthrobacter sp. BL-252-APC-1A]|uniref:alpha/beta hydrolase n=1 Tax=Arthrobacter sp. BL-252-APC-1A TaxID=2606622 RepID=UPI0012B4115B|nr:alpha/beta hydrolase [Arthrobacter sp. BL-252-APC-1A]MSR98394.1 alpha/beta hydrolase [Arthrobacter sp. BL-252-APC-1A]